MQITFILLYVLIIHDIFFFTSILITLILINASLSGKKQTHKDVFLIFTIDIRILLKNILKVIFL